MAPEAPIVSPKAWKGPLSGAFLLAHGSSRS